jgi:hypothetical protein
MPRVGPGVREDRHESTVGDSSAQCIDVRCAYMLHLLRQMP